VAGICSSVEQARVMIRVSISLCRMKIKNDLYSYLLNFITHSEVDIHVYL